MSSTTERFPRVSRDNPMRSPDVFSGPYRYSSRFPRSWRLILLDWVRKLIL